MRDRSLPGQGMNGRAWRAAPLAMLALLGAAAALPARAALFDDDEARRQIAELRRQVEGSDRMLNERLGALEAAVQDRRALLDLASAIEALKQDIARLRGQNETLLNQAENLERRQRDLYVDLDTRLRKMEQAQQQLQQGQTQLQQSQAQLQEKLTAPEREAAKEKETYENALNQFRQNNFGASIAAFQAFMSAYPSSQLVPSAQYWVGNAYYALRDYGNAIAAQQKILATWPDNAKAPDALLNIASSQAEMGDQRAARETLQQLLKKFPTSPAAEQAKQRLQRR